MLEKSYLYYFKMDLFDNVNPEEFLLLVWIFQMMLQALGAIGDSTKIKYLCTLPYDEALCQPDMFSFEVVSTTTTHLTTLFRVKVRISLLLMCCQRKSARCDVE